MHTYRGQKRKEKAACDSKRRWFDHVLRGHGMQVQRHDKLITECVKGEQGRPKIVCRKVVLKDLLSLGIHTNLVKNITHA